MKLSGFFLSGFIIASSLVHAQVDTVKQDTTSLINKIQNSKASKSLVNSITRNREDTVFNAKSEDIFMPFNGKIIRRIIIKHIGFDKTMYDTTRSIKNTVTRIGNALHGNTKEWVIRDNLFFYKGDQLNPYKLADNERYLRDLDFILDAHIKVRKVRGDSVDITVTTRDVFSLGATVSPRSATDYKFRLRDTNLAGWGQRLQVNGSIDNDRNPAFGPEVIYTKSSIGGTLANLSVGFTTLNTASSYGDENEYATYIRLDRPLISPYSRMAGAIELSKNWSRNVFQLVDTIFRRYNYNIADFWIGYNIGINSKLKNRNRNFVSVRTFYQSFAGRPAQNLELMNPNYNNKTYVLGQFTFFNQNFYKTRYIYGFGRTEDVPYGRRLSLLTGWASQLNLDRLYLGADFEHSIANRSGDFYQYILRVGGFRYKHDFQDVTLLISGAINSRLYVYPQFKLRQYFRLGYTSIIKQNLNNLLTLDNDFGVIGFPGDSVRGVQRLGAHSETVVFTNWKLLGFRFAPLVFGDFAFISKQSQHIFYDKPFYGVGLGIRTRNENLIFGTIEARCTFYPRVEKDDSHFRLSLRSNLRIKSTGNLVRAPSFISYN
jgi:hypothetical protein